MSTAADSHAQRENARETPGADRPEPGTDAAPEELETDIARTRRELGETLESLTDRLDPKAQADKQVEHVKERARDQVDRARASARSTLSQARRAVADPHTPVPGLLAALAAAAVFASLGLLITRRR